MTGQIARALALGSLKARLGRSLLPFVTLTMITGAAFLLLPQPDASSLGVDGTRGDDHIVGTPRHDEIFAHRGDDDVRARGGLDLVEGGRGSDTLYLGPGRRGDEGRGGKGNDTVIGGPGPDKFFEAAGRDRIYGGLGNDVFVPGAGVDHVYGGPGDDSFMTFGHEGRRDVIACGPGRDAVSWDNMRDKLLDRTIGCEVLGSPSLGDSELFPRVVDAGR